MQKQQYLSINVYSSAFQSFFVKGVNVPVQIMNQIKP